MNNSPVRFDTAIYWRGGGGVFGESANDGMQTEPQRLSYQIVQLRGPGFTPQLSERRSVLRALEKPATGSCNCVAPDSLFNCQREEAFFALWRSLQLDRAIAWPRIHSSTFRENKRSSSSREACDWNTNRKKKEKEKKIVAPISLPEWVSERSDSDMRAAGTREEKSVVALEDSGSSSSNARQEDEDEGEERRRRR